jgi:translation initiation factor 1
MAKKNTEGGLIYSTNPDQPLHQQFEEEAPRIPNEKQDLRVWLERKGGGKLATVVKGYIGPTDDLEQLARTLKTACGVGGGVKDGDILIQGDHRDKVIARLSALGFRSKKAGG